MNRVGLYVHIPYCKRKCRYCDFFSVTNLLSTDGYVEAILREARRYQGEDFSIDTVFVGGGTPSLLGEAAWRKLMEGLRVILPIESGAEISVECNPDSASEALFALWKELGVNRVSLGVQSLNDKVLATVGRLHDGKSALVAVNNACKVFDNVNVDYMVGLPYQTVGGVQDDLRRLLSLGVSHVSVYSLILEEGTPLYTSVKKGEITLPDDEVAVDLYDAAVATLEAAGFQRYEISNFCRAGKECKHNLHCWQLYPYIGLGAAAHSFYGGKRYAHPCDLDRYMLGGEPIPEDCENDRRGEAVMLGLRTAEGVYLSRYSELFGRDFTVDFAAALQNPTIQPCLVVNDKSVSIRPEYLYVSNGIINIFLDCLE